MYQRKPTAKEQLRASQRQLTNGVRDLEREALQLKREETRLVKEIKASAAKDNQPLVRQLAKSLVRTRQQLSRLNASQAQLRGVRSNLTTTAATSTVASSMQNANRAMAAMGQVTDPHKIQQDMQAFARQNQRMDMASELMDDAIDNAFEDDEDEASDVMNQVLDEIGIDLGSTLAAAPRSKARVAEGAAAKDSELEAALAALR